MDARTASPSAAEYAGPMPARATQIQPVAPPTDAQIRIDECRKFLDSLGSEAAMVTDFDPESTDINMANSQNANLHSMLLQRNEAMDRFNSALQERIFELEAELRNVTRNNVDCVRRAFLFK